MVDSKKMKLLLLLVIAATAQSDTDKTLGRGFCESEDLMETYGRCTSCAARYTCPPKQSTLRTENCTYQVSIGGRQLELSGCRAICGRRFSKINCCPQFWGALCLACPSWSGKTCNFQGSCSDGINGNGTCLCDDKFTGFACNECKNPNAYGVNCDKVCDCEHGICNKGPEGDGQCFCQPPYVGKRCDQMTSGCRSCPPYSYCRRDGNSAVCECLPGHRKTNEGRCAVVCSSRDCDVNAGCSSKGSKISCACNPDYEGNGRVCVPKNPCNQNNGGCPTNYTVCVFTGPNKSKCECMKGMRPLGGSGQFGCELVSACQKDSCHPSASCRTGMDGHARCECSSDQIGDGNRCYGNLMEQLLELDRTGDHRGNLTATIALFEKGCSLLLNHNGPFTAFIPLLQTPLTGVNEEEVCKNHLILGEHLYKDLDGKDLSLYGGGRMRSKGNKRLILMDDPSVLYTILSENHPAANGVIHIIDRVMISSMHRPSRNDKFADLTIGEILRKDDQFNRFLSLVDNCGAALPLRGTGPLTVFVPTNQAIDAARDGSILYMINNARHKLQELLRYHIMTQASLTSDELAVLPRIHTMANQFIRVSVTDDGQLVLGDKGIHLVTTNYMASNGIIHVIDGLLVPPSIVPIMPHRCDVVENKITVGPCVHCSYLFETNCPVGSVEMDSHMIGCDYLVSESSFGTTKGCAKYCNTTKTVAECCKGFYGPDCKPCIGGFEHPCFDKGTCSDGIKGDGSCACHPGFEGVACHICSDRGKHGPNCDEECKCVQGVCDNRPGSGGRCRVGSCSEGFSGDFCDKKETPCNSDGLKEHCHIHAFCTRRGFNSVCICQDGYEGDGHSCSPINPCLKSSRGDCDINAACVYNGPGNASCVCSEGWSGDGKVCVEINLCKNESRGDCSPNATCVHLGPAQAECVCKKGYSGNGKVCDLINACSENNGGCHELATCKQHEAGNHTCTCPDGFHGNGNTCYGTILEELEMMQWRVTDLFRVIRRIRGIPKELDGNITVLSPSRAALDNLSVEQYGFWVHRHHVLHFIRSHILLGVYSVEDLDKLVGSKVSTLNTPTKWEVTKSSTGIIRIGNASIINHNHPAINGFIHIMDKALPPSLSEIPPDPPTLMDFLNTTTNFTLFRNYAQLYNLSGELRSSFTLLLPTDQAIREYMQKNNLTALDNDTLKYHIIPEPPLFPELLYDGLVKSTFLGKEYQLQFHINDNNQTAVNNVPIGNSFTETANGLILVVNQVLIVQRNRCGKPFIVHSNGRCTDCNEAPQCPYKYKPVQDQFPPNMKSNCKFRKRVGPRFKSVPGCVIRCTKVITDQSCCPGYYGHGCYKCPGEVGSPCSNHGQCQDGHDGDGECRCFEGFHGTACEDCEPGRYGTNCSKQCRCNHGKCADGLTGSGRCDCYKGWKGSTCAIEIRDDACGGSCDHNANCITGPQGSAPACVCVAGYEGNGTHCTELDLCKMSNGGCSPFAVCTKVSAGERTCSCNQGYTGDGVVCIEFDGCLVNNGGCHESAECLRTGPNTTACRCLSGFSGSGRYCLAVNPCREDNGGCSRFAYCSYLGQGQRNCTCRNGYVGDGFDCRGGVNTEITRQAENSFFRHMFTLSGIRSLYGDGPYTVFVPLEETNNLTTVTEWGDKGRIADLVRYHIVSCEKLSFTDLKTTDRVVAQSGHTLRFSYKQGSLWINDLSRIVRSDYTTSNGLIHHIDTLLTPYILQNKVPIKVGKDQAFSSDPFSSNPFSSNSFGTVSSTQHSVQMNLTEAAAFYGYTEFYKLIEASGVLSVLEMSIHRPFTMFWPSDKAMTSLPVERQRWLTSPDHQEQLAAIVKGHIIRNAKVMAISTPDKYQTSFRSMHGSTINYSCDKKLVGNILLNDNAAQVIERYMMFTDGMAYGIDQLLEPPGLGAHCDGIENKTTYGRCGRCLFPPSCRYRHIDTGKVESCRSFSRYRYSLDLDLSPFGRRGCKRVCQYPSWTQQCCKNHYGRDCTACPGGVESPCGFHGTCEDGMKGTGHCACEKNFRGDSCELCLRNHYGPNCTACACTNRGSCEDGLEGSGACSCDSGWIGDRCQTELSSIPEECRECHKDAQCEPGSGCSCKPSFQGNGTFCEPLPPPDLCAEYNGGCHSHADCHQTGLLVNCTCHIGYQGDGFTCQPINRCTAETNGGCSDFASCTFTGPNERDCACLPGYVGNGIQCLEKALPPVDRCLENNGDCDPVAQCKDLHYHTNTGGVYHLRSPLGRYQMNFTEAKAACENDGGVLATFKQLGDAQQLGMHLCTAGWFEGGKVGYPIRFPSLGCGGNQVGVVQYPDPMDQRRKYDAYCYRLRDVSCSCPSDFVGNGDFCNGVLADVLATNSNFSIFYRFLLDYSGSAKDGKKLVEFLSQRNANVTLFVPHNDGFTFNKTLTGRDLEYHISKNQSRRAFIELKHKEVIVSRLGFNLTVTHGKNESIKLVNRRLLLDWDIPAVNGLIHVIEGPLTAPPPPISHPARRLLHPSSSAAAILVSLFVACIVAAVGYYIFKHKTDAFRFHYFKNEDEDGGSMNRPALVSIPNPLYVGSSNAQNPSGPESSQEPEPPAEPEEPPQILELDQ